MPESTLQRNASVGNSKKWSQVLGIEGEFAVTLPKTLYFSLGTPRKGASLVKCNLCSLHGEGNGFFASLLFWLLEQDKL